MRLGRVSENDVVVHDPSVSRRHARIFLKLGKYLVEDVGSTHGTQVNQEPVKGERPLDDGDILLLGEVVFRVGIQKPPVSSADTRILEGPTSRVRVGVNRTSTDAELQAFEIAPTDYKSSASMPALQALTDVETDPVGDEPARAITPARPAKAVAPARPSRVPAKQAAAPSAADRARRRRQAGESLGGQLAFWWSELRPAAKVLVGSLTGAVVVGILLGVGLVLRPDTTKVGPEPDRLTNHPLRDSFGLGDDVTWNRPDMKVFTFQFVAPTQAVALLHYQARDISDKEVTVTLNGAELGVVPADTADVYERELELVLPPGRLKQNAPNKLIFDNVRNPPGKEPWRIWNLWVEIIPIPALSHDELVAQAADYVKKGKGFLDLKDVGSENLFRAWKSYRSAWITLEALDKKPELYELVRVQMNSIAQQLNQQCAKLMLEAQRQIQFKNRKKARQVLDEVSRYFPTAEHRCHNLALEKLNQHEL